MFDDGTSFFSSGEVAAPEFASEDQAFIIPEFTPTPTPIPEVSLMEAAFDTDAVLEHLSDITNLETENQQLSQVNESLQSVVEGAATSDQMDMVISCLQLIHEDQISIARSNEIYQGLSLAILCMILGGFVAYAFFSKVR